MSALQTLRDIAALCFIAASVLMLFATLVAGFIA